MTLDAARQERNEAAKVLFVHLTNKAIPDGIASCIARQSPSLTIDLPRELVGTPSLTALDHWLEAEELASVILSTAAQQLTLTIVPR